MHRQAASVAPLTNILFLSYSKKCKVSGDKVFKEMFVAAQPTIAKLWNPPRCPPTEERIKKMGYLSTMEYYPALNKNEMMAFAGRGMEPEMILLSEISQSPPKKQRLNVRCDNPMLIHFRR